jgi:hypothetical protein
MQKTPSTFTFGGFSTKSNGSGHRRTPSWNIKSNMEAMDASTAKTKAAATEVKRITFSKEAFNLVAQFVTGLKKYVASDGTASKNRKCLFMVGNLDKTEITEEAQEFLARDAENPHSLHLFPKYTKAATSLWDDLEKERPLHEDDYIDLMTNGCYYISIPDSLASSCSPGDIVLLYDVRFSVHVAREDLKNVKKLESLTPAQTAWKGKRATKVVEGTTIEYDVKPRKPRFFFTAKFGTKLPAVSIESLMKVYQDQGFLTHHIGNPLADGSSRSSAYTEDEDVFRMNKQWYDSQEIVRISYDPQYDGSVMSMPFFAPDGKAYSFEVFSFPDRYISENDIKSDECKFDCVKSRTETDIKNKAWCFMVRVSQRVWEKAANPDDYADTDGFDTDHPVEDTLFSARINIYKEVLERDFGIFSYGIWIPFVSCYGKYFRGTFQCILNWKKTQNRMDRLESLAGAGGMSSGGGGEDGGERDTLASRPFDYTIDYTCNSILFSMRDFIKRIGVPIRKDTASKLLDTLQRSRRRPDATQTGSVASMSQIPTKARHSVACLNELQGISVAKKILEEPSNQAYAVLLPNPEHLGAKLFGMIEELTNQADGSVLLEALHLGVPLNTKKYGNTPIGKLVGTFEMTGYESKCEHPLIFIVGDDDSSTYTHEADTLAKFLGISGEMLPQLSAYLKGEPIPEEKGKEHAEEEDVKDEEADYEEIRQTDQEILEMGTQNALMETLGSQDIFPEVDEGDLEADEGHEMPLEKPPAPSGKRKSSGSSRAKSKPGSRRTSSKRPRSRRV